LFLEKAYDLSDTAVLKFRMAPARWVKQIRFYPILLSPLQSKQQHTERPPELNDEPVCASLDQTEERRLRNWQGDNIDPRVDEN
jgi:hypothetical protein